MAFGGFQAGLASAAYHAPGMNREPAHAAAKVTPSHPSRPSMLFVISMTALQIPFMINNPLDARLKLSVRRLRRPVQPGVAPAKAKTSSAASPTS